MKYYRCLKSYENTPKFCTEGLYYRGDDCGNERSMNKNYTTINKFIFNCGSNKGLKYFKEVTQLEYLKSIDIKSKLIELANSNKYAIILNSKEDADKLDKLFILLHHFHYKEEGYLPLKAWWSKEGQTVDFELTNRTPYSKDKIMITIKELLNYV